MQRVRDECGDVGYFQLAGKKVILLTGAEADEFFFRAADDDLGRRGLPVHDTDLRQGCGVRRQPRAAQGDAAQPALRGDHMRSHARTIEREVRRMIENWGDEGEIDLLDTFAELTIYTSTACLIGRKFREQLDSRFASYYHLLERGTDPLCYVDPICRSRAFGCGMKPAKVSSPWCRRS